MLHVGLKRTLKEKILSQLDLLGYIDIVGDSYSKMACVISVDTKYSPKLIMYSLKNGNNLECKIDKRSFNKNKLSKGDIVMINTSRYKPKVKKTESGWVEIPGTKELWITKYVKVDNL